MNRTARTLIALTSATALTASVAVAAHAAQIDIGPDEHVISAANTVWESRATISYGFEIQEATIYADTVDPAAPRAGDRVSDDAFDGGLAIWVEGDEYGVPDCTGTCTYVVEVTSDGGDTLVQGPPEVLSGLTVSVQQRFYAGGDLARVLASYTNPTSAPITVITGAFSDYGSDGATTLEGDSSGDDSVSEADHWIITGDDEDDIDPIVTTAWSRAGASKLPDYAGLGDADEDLSTDESAAAFELTIQPGETVHLAYFVKIHGWESGPTPSPTASPTVTGVELEGLGEDLAAAASISSDYAAAVAAATTDAAEFDTFTGRLTAGLANGTVVLNWGTVGGAAPADPADPVIADPNFTG